MSTSTRLVFYRAAAEPDLFRGLFFATAKGGYFIIMEQNTTIKRGLMIQNRKVASYMALSSELAEAAGKGY